jgi:hypothetical protein
MPYAFRSCSACAFGLGGGIQTAGYAKQNAWEMVDCKARKMQKSSDRGHLPTKAREAIIRRSLATAGIKATHSVVKGSSN